MSLKKDGIMIILSSPSGAGKTTLTNLLSRKFRDSKTELEKFIKREDLNSVSKLDFPEIYRHGTYSFIKVYGKNILREILKEHLILILVRIKLMEIYLLK